MSAADEAPRQPMLSAREESQALSDQWRSLRRSATFVAVLSAPAAFIWLWKSQDMSLGWAIVATAAAVFAFRGLMDLVFRKFIPQPSLFSLDDADVREEDVLNRRRHWFWRFWYRIALFFVAIITIVFLLQWIFGGDVTWWGTATSMWDGLKSGFGNTALLSQLIILPFFFIFNFLILMGPMMMMGISQIKGFEPGDANWGVKLEDVRGQAEAKEEVRRIVSLWQSGEAFELAGGRRERGILFHGAPGTGKTMLAKAIATGFNCPFVSIPGSGFAQAQPLDAKILTPWGWTTMGAIQVGDEVIDPEGGTARVIGVFPQGERDIYRVTFSDGSSTECDLDHLWQIRCDGRRDWQVENLGSIKDKLETDSRQNRPYIPLVENLEFEEAELPVDPYLLGKQLGDESAIAAELELVGTAERDPRARGVSETFGLRDCTARGQATARFVPDAYKWGSLETRLQLLNGLMDSGGGNEHGEGVFTTSSAALAHDVVFLSRSLGGNPRAKRTDNAWTVTMDSEPSRHVVSIELVGRKQAQCIKLDSANELYVTDDFIVTHNTFIGVDVLIVRYMARKAKRLAAKWGGQCIVFIDEIDAVAMRRSSLGASMTDSTAGRYDDHIFYGPYGSQTSSGDLILETRGWREWMFEQRSSSPARYPAWYVKLAGIVNQGAFPGMFGGGMGGMALNQLLVTMDGIDNPPFWRRFWTNRFNNLLDASYVVPRRLRNMPLRFPPARPAGNQIYFIGATNVPLDALDPAIQRPGRMGRHVWFRTPTKADREDIFTLYLGKVSHDAELDTQRARDELARITAGYSPAMIEQVCSMALTQAHFENREEFGRQDIIEAMTTVESGTAVGIEYIPEETRAVAIHEAGHATTAHVFLKGSESTRLSIRMRSGSLGHHMALEKEERFSSWKHEEMAKLAWTLGALAAEHVFYGENGVGVGGDLGSATGRAAWMVGLSGMGPDPIVINTADRDPDKLVAARRALARRFEELGVHLMNRASGDPAHSSIAQVLSDRDKRAYAAQILGQAYVNAYNFVAQNKTGVEKIAEELIVRRELYGDELVELLNSVGLKEPVVDLEKEETWPIL